MFQLTLINDMIRIPPSNFDSSSNTPSSSIALAINQKYANKVLPDVGLCICLFDVLSCAEGKVRGGDGCAHHDTTFRLVVFRPFVNEVLIGTVKQMDKDGIRVGMGFFDDIFIPEHHMRNHSTFDHKEQAWFWLSEPSAAELQDPFASDPQDRFYTDLGNRIRFVVEEAIFQESEPDPKAFRPQGAQGAAAIGISGGAIPGAMAEGSSAQKKPPFRIIGSVGSDGLGVTHHWVSAETMMEGDMEGIVEG